MSFSGLPGEVYTVWLLLQEGMFIHHQIIQTGCESDVFREYMSDCLVIIWEVLNKELPVPVW
jgi:hypothetical protein